MHPDLIGESSDIKAFGHALVGADRVLVVTHVGPDGDALGSLTAVGLVLRGLGKHVTLAVDGGMLSRFSYLGMANAVQAEIAPWSDFDLVIAVDCGDEERMGQVFANLAHPLPPVLNVDHHITNTMFGTWNVVSAESSSAAAVLFDLFQQLDLPMTRDVAVSLLTGIVTDTLCFSTSNVTPHTLAIASQLMSAGADLATITMQALNLQEYATISMWREGLNGVRLEDGLIWTSVSRAARERAGVRRVSTSGLVSMLGNVIEAQIAAVLIEADDGSVKISFRCRPPIDVSGIAARLGGGGHPQASGCSLPGPLAQAEATVVALAKRSIAEQIN